MRYCSCFSDCKCNILEKVYCRVVVIFKNKEESKSILKFCHPEISTIVCDFFSCYLLSPLYKAAQRVTVSYK